MKILTVDRCSFVIKTARTFTRISKLAHGEIKLRLDRQIVNHRFDNLKKWQNINFADDTSLWGVTGLLNKNTIY